MSTPHTSRVVEAYLFFNGCCEEALEFYRKALGAEILALMRFKDSPDPEMKAAGKPDKVMHAVFRVGDTKILASDGHGEGKAKFEGFALSISVPTEAEADRTIWQDSTRLALAATWRIEPFGCRRLPNSCPFVTFVTKAVSASFRLWDPLAWRSRLHGGSNHLVAAVLLLATWT